MRAIIWTAYGPPEVLQEQEIDRPVPKDDEVLVRIVAANVFPGDCEMRRFQMHPLYWLPLRLFLGIRKPRIKIIGQEFAGIVTAVGASVSRFKVGDAVFAPTALGGAYAEYVCAKEAIMAQKPESLSFADAATLSVGGLNALHFLRGGLVGPGQKVLIYGAAGSIGTWAVQLAVHFGATVTAVDHGSKLAALRALGATNVLDYERDDFAQRGETFDVIVDVVGKSGYSRSVRCIKPGGYFILGNAPTLDLLRSLWSRWTTHCRVKPMLTGYKLDNLEFLAELAGAGKIHGVIDRTYPLELVVDAHHYVDTGKKIGNVVLTVSEAP